MNRYLGRGTSSGGRDRKGKRVKIKAKDLLAQAICHEYDHLEGEVFVDKIVPGTMEYVEPEK